MWKSRSCHCFVSKSKRKSRRTDSPCPRVSTQFQFRDRKRVTSSGRKVSRNVTLTRDRQGENGVKVLSEGSRCHTCPSLSPTETQLNASLRWWSICPCLNVSLDACTTNRRRWYWIRCSMLSCLTPYMSSMDVFDVFLPASSLCTAVLTHDLCPAVSRGEFTFYASI